MGGQIIMYLSLGLVLLWTARLAHSKGYRFYLWAGAAFLLMLIPESIIPNSQLLGMVPLGLLMFLKNRRVRPDVEQQEYIECPRCHARHSIGHNFCVECGWKLETPENAYAEDPIPAEPQPAAPDFSHQSEPATTADREPEPVLASNEQQDIGEEVKPAETPAPPPEPDPQPRRPAVMRPLTAETLTERGVSLLDEGRVQEAIDQFTKAIALNARYRRAWSLRAEAYDKLGRNREAAEDLRRLEAI